MSLHISHFPWLWCIIKNIEFRTHSYECGATWRNVLNFTELYVWVKSPRTPLITHASSWSNILSKTCPEAQSTMVPRGSDRLCGQLTEKWHGSTIQHSFTSAQATSYWPDRFDPPDNSTLLADFATWQVVKLHEISTKQYDCPSSSDVNFGENLYGANICTLNIFTISNGISIVSLLYSLYCSLF